MNNVPETMPDAEKLKISETQNQRPALAQKNMPALSYAASGNLQAVEKLLKNGHNPNTTNSFGRSAMHFGAISNNAEILFKLEEFGGDIKAQTDGGDTVLSQAVIWHASKTAAWLVGRGVDPFEPNKEGRTAMDIAQEVGSTECIAVFSAFLARREINNLLNSLSAPRA